MALAGNTDAMHPATQNNRMDLFFFHAIPAIVPLPRPFPFANATLQNRRRSRYKSFMQI